MAHQNPTCWLELLPIILLGLSAAVKEDLACCPAQLVYGTSLRLPAKLATPLHPTAAPPKIETYVERLQNIFREIRPIPTWAKATTKPFIS